MRRPNLPAGLVTSEGDFVDIRSTPSGYNPKTPSSRARDAASAPAPAASPTRPAAASAAPADAAPVDRVELSSAARELNQRLESGTGDSGLSPERIQLLASRMRSGYYDQAPTVDRILDGVRSELTRDDSRE
jgi:hypothetical protein